MSVMLNEFLSAPAAMRKVSKNNKKVIEKIAEAFKARKITNITTVARGTSDNAATYFKYLIEAIGGIMVSKFSPSINTIYGSVVNLKDNMLIAISQSGMSTDTLMVVENAKKTGALVVGVTNNSESPLAKACDYHIDLLVDEEASVSATKTFIAELTAMYMLVNKLSATSAKTNIDGIPPLLDSFITRKDDIKDFADRVKHIDNFIILSRGLLQSVTNELSLKLMETSNKFSRPFSTSEFMHGPISMVREGTVVLMLAPDSEFSQEFISMARRLSLLGAEIIAFTDIPDVKNISKECLEMPSGRGMESPFIYTMAVELFAAYLAECLGINPDAPRNRKKITITK
ncbi:MAG: SIS domain-containing protein [Christensenellaceae bacterium]|jgi:glucosamine--fructose-6-phosphate aminotransferase (isomerizing)|nr:SIS domain-containing protein [Christensenellaceae bacterium]